MATQHIHRLLIVAPAGVCGALNAAIRNNIAPGEGDWLTPGLSAGGNPPATHAWACAALTNAQVAFVLNRWYALAGMTPPPWGPLTRQQVRARILADRPALIAASQVAIFHMDNDGAWDDPSAILAARGLKPVRAAALQKQRLLSVRASSP